jgi:hypothetical protein
VFILGAADVVSMDFRTPIFLTVVAAALATPVSAGTVLTFDVVSHTEGGQGGKERTHAD